MSLQACVSALHTSTTRVDLHLQFTLARRKSHYTERFSPLIISFPPLSPRHSPAPRLLHFGGVSVLFDITLQEIHTWKPGSWQPTAHKCPCLPPLMHFLPSSGPPRGAGRPSEQPHCKGDKTKKGFCTNPNQVGMARRTAPQADRRGFLLLAPTPLQQNHLQNGLKNPCHYFHVLNSKDYSKILKVKRPAWF